MFVKPIARTLAVFGLHARPPEDSASPRAVFADADGEMPTPAVAPAPRIPPHQRHLYVRQDDALKGYSMGSYRPAASMATAEAPAHKRAKSHKSGKASPLTA